jgi:hypothetical protein
MKGLLLSQTNTVGQQYLLPLLSFPACGLQHPHFGSLLLFALLSVLQLLLLLLLLLDLLLLPEQQLLLILLLQLPLLLLEQQLSLVVLVLLLLLPPLLLLNLLHFLLLLQHLLLLPPLLLHLLRSFLQCQLQHIHGLPTSSSTAQQAAPGIAAPAVLLTNMQQRQRAKVAAAWPLHLRLLQACGDLMHKLASC